MQQSETIENTRDQTKRIWDLPVRLFHWSLVLAFAAAWITSENDRYLNWHVFSGYLILGLILFRLVWGMVGSRYARFSSFMFGFQRAKQHVQSVMNLRPESHVGHNPAGSWAIYLLLIGNLLVVVSGLFVFGGEENHGPASDFLVRSLAWLARFVHSGVATVLLAVVAIHICGVVAESLLLKEKLIPAMLHGKKTVSANTPGVAVHYLGAAFLVGLLAIIVASAITERVSGEKPLQFSLFHSVFQGPELVYSETWQSECSDCHIAYHPSLLPARSWNKLLDQQDQHFGEDLYLEADTIQLLKDYARGNSADHKVTEPAYKILASLQPGDMPLRITETPYWKRKHEEVSKVVWQQSNVGGKAQCNACHQDAKQGWFEDSKMHVPDKTTSG